MATSLRDNLTSSYFNAAHKLYSKKARRRIIAYVESYDDVAFWFFNLSQSAIRVFGYILTCMKPKNDMIIFDSQ